jgi:glycosyltransferase involved in cell wall biosynthesis
VLDPPISGFVVTYNRANVLEACLTRLRFVDELIVVDKSSTDSTPEIARRFADLYEKVPWTPLAEDTRGYAESLCSYDWILFLDDDEVLSPDAGNLLRRAISEQPADVYAIPIRHYFLGRRDERKDNLEHRPSLYRRGSLIHSKVIHEIPEIRGNLVYLTGVHIENLSHPNIHSWISKMNGFTSGRCNQSPRDLPCASLIDFAQGVFSVLDGVRFPDQWHEAVALLYLIYDLVDGLKCWEATQPDGQEVFDAFCREVLACP